MSLCCKLAILQEDLHEENTLAASRGSCLMQLQIIFTGMPFMHRPNYHPHFEDYMDDDDDEYEEECCCHHHHHHHHHPQQFTTG